MSIADRDRELLGIRRRRLVERADVHVVVADPVHLRESHHYPPIRSLITRLDDHPVRRDGGRRGIGTTLSRPGRADKEPRSRGASDRALTDPGPCTAFAEYQRSPYNLRVISNAPAPPN